MQGVNGQFIYTLKDPSKAFDLDSKTGKLKMKNSALFDREKFDSFQLEVSAIEAKKSLVTKMQEKERSNLANPPNKITITINVDDDNDNSPEFSPSKKI